MINETVTFFICFIDKMKLNIFQKSVAILLIIVVFAKRILTNFYIWLHGGIQ